MIRYRLRPEDPAGIAEDQVPDEEVSVERASIWVPLRVRAAEKGHNASGWRAEIPEGIETRGTRVGAGRSTRQCRGPDDVRSGS